MGSLAVALTGRALRTSCAVAAGVDNRGMLEIACQAKIGLTGGPLYYR